ncbi:hypothetical protein Tco_1112530 [Tanacetum coccineum]|uniref:Uncharacterized protein n=1 Tax=Tanacetum coccineum TaxID=301880 RepID=A0ABQ5IRY9_9ASTR
MTVASIKALIAQGVANALAEYETHRSSVNGDDSHESGSGRRTERAARECTYSDFLKCQPLNFKGSEGVTVGHDVAYGMPKKTLKKMMTDNNNQHFQELALMCSRMFPKESDEVEKYVDGLPDMIQGNIVRRTTPLCAGFSAIKEIMDPNSSLGKICLGENVVEISSDNVEGSKDWDSPEYQDTANSGGKKETKAMVFHKMDTE